MDDISKGIGGVVAAVIGVAVLAVVLSNGANTVGVLGAFFAGVRNLLATAISPITGQTTGANTAALPGGAWSGGNQQFGSLLGGFTGSGGYAGSSGAGGGILGGFLGGGGSSGGFSLGGLLASATAGSGLPGTGSDPTGGMFGSQASGIGSLFVAPNLFG
jgi:hypothetical protein